MRRVLLACALLLAVPTAAGGHEVVSADLELDRLQGMVSSPIRAALGTPPALTAMETSAELELVGHTPLNFRGMNSALAIQSTGDKRFAYVGSRTDGTHAMSGVMVVDVTNPASPTIVREIGLPNEGNVGESSRELRVIPHQDLLLVLNHGCSELIHRCANGAAVGVSLPRSNIRVYDVAGEKAADPELVATYQPSRNAAQQPHEFFVWTDPQDPERILLYSSTPSDSGSQPQLVVTDFSRARDGVFPEIATWRTHINNPGRDNRLHSLTVSHDGRRAYLAYLGGGFLVLDTSQLADGAEHPQMTLVTPVEQRVFWTDPGAHSAIKLPGRDFALVTDEVYGRLGGLLGSHGCPWGWVRIIDIEEPEAPSIAAEYKLPVNEASTCANVDPVRNNLASFSAHNPTLTKNLAFVTWHSAGLQVIDLSDPREPTPAAQFLPEPLPAVQTEDPALSSGTDKVVMWSFPVIVDGLIYVVDLRNGLYVLRYDGKHDQEVKRVDYLDGNSNSGDVGKLEKD